MPGLDPTPLRMALDGLAGRLLDGVATPAVGAVRPRLDAPVVEDLEGTVRREVARALEGVRRGPLAIGLGSRGLADLGRLAAAVVATARELGFDPFVVPAMGSHGAATAAGQAAVLADSGVDPALIRATMETVVVGEALGVPVHIDRHAYEAGAVFLVNRVKPHTSFRGPVESGLAKMCAVGLGKQPGARLMHSRGVAGLAELIPAAARLVAQRRLLAGGLAIVENQRDQTALVRGLTAAEVGAEAESALLAEARRLMPTLPFADLDVLVVERMGKDISGAGIDTNVVGRMRVSGQPEPDPRSVISIVVLDLTDASHGNAMGIGTADFTTSRLLAKIDFEALYTNAITAGVVGIRRMALPCVMATDRDAIMAAIATRGRAGPLRLAWIRDTLHTELVGCTEALLEEARGRDDLEVVREAVAMAFAGDGGLLPLS